MVISHPTNTQICHLSRPEFYFQFCDRGSGERNTFFSFSKIGAFDLKAETVVMKRKATKPGGSGRGKSQVSPFKRLCFACEDRLVGFDLEMGS